MQSRRGMNHLTNLKRRVCRNEKNLDATLPSSRSKIFVATATVCAFMSLLKVVVVCDVMSNVRKQQPNRQVAE